MLTIAYYFLQVVLCSALMMGYYWLVLRNKRFHQYNRFYLLAIAVLSWIVPLIKIKWGQPAANDLQVMQLLSVVADNNTQIEETLSSKGFAWNTDMAVTVLYVTISAALLFAMIVALVRIYRLLQEHSCKNVGEVYLIITQAKGTPFSFFRYIFWNEEIDIRSESGKQILQHELTHVQQKHSIDKIFIQLNLVIGWFNPFFWLLKKEMEMIHEFIADKKAVNNGDAASLAQMLLTAAYPNQHFALTHPFFFSPIKRRLQMLTNNTNPRFSYLRRLVVLPLLAVVVILFAFRSTGQKSQGTLSVASVMENVVDELSDKINTEAKSLPIGVSNIAVLDRVYTIVINPGHGGADVGAIAADGTTESSLTLQLAKAVKEMNTNENIRIVLTRNEDVYFPANKTIELVNEYHPDLFLSLHINNASPVKHSGGSVTENPATGIAFYIAEKNKTSHYLSSQALASDIANAFAPMNEKIIGIKTGKNGLSLEKVQSAGVWIEAGFITNSNDIKKLKDDDYRKQLAVSILNGVNEYLVKFSRNAPDTLILKADTITVKNGSKLVVINQGGEVKVIKNEVSKMAAEISLAENKPLIILDGIKIDNSVLSVIDPNKIATIDVLKNESATALYGSEGKYGVILVRTKAVDVTNFGARTTVRPHSNNVRMGFPLQSVDSAQSLSVSSSNRLSINNGSGPQPIWIVDGEPTEITAMENFNPNNIKSVSVLKGEKAIQKYGDKAVNGVVEITTKQKQFAAKLDDVVVIDYNESDPTGIKALKSRNPDVKHAYLLKSPLTLTVELKNGSKEVYNLLANSDRKKAENKYGKLPALPNVKITSLNTNSNIADTIFLQRQTPAEFPGGVSSWSKYLMRNLDKEIVRKHGGPPGKYTVVVSFTVDEYGGLSNIKALNDPGYGAKEEAIRMIAKGPKWKPAQQNGKSVRSVHEQSISFLVLEEEKKTLR